MRMQPSVSPHAYTARPKDVDSCISVLFCIRRRTFHFVFVVWRKICPRRYIQFNSTDFAIICVVFYSRRRELLRVPACGASVILMRKQHDLFVKSPRSKRSLLNTCPHSVHGATSEIQTSFQKCAEEEVMTRGGGRGWYQWPSKTWLIWWFTW